MKPFMRTSAPVEVLTRDPATKKKYILVSMASVAKNRKIRISQNLPKGKRLKTRKTAVKPTTTKKAC